MRRLIAGLLVAPLLLLASAPVAHAGARTDIALGLASFAVFNQIVAPLIAPPVFRREVVYTSAPPVAVYAPPPVYVAAPPAVVYSSRPVVYAGPPAPPPPAVVRYPHGRYELQLQGRQYVWVWIPAVTPPPPPPPPAP
jgi:hypothetical protein